MRWMVEFPTLDADGQQHGAQWFTYKTDFWADACERALADVNTDRAVNHRRGAGIDLEHMTVEPCEPWQGGALL